MKKKTIDIFHPFFLYPNIPKRRTTPATKPLRHALLTSRRHRGSPVPHNRFVPRHNTFLSSRAGTPRNRRCGDLLGLHQRPVALDLLVAHDDKVRHDTQPIQVVRDDGAVRSRVCPAENGVEESPASTTVVIGAAALSGVSIDPQGKEVRPVSKTYVEMPHRAVNVIRAWPRA